MMGVMGQNNNRSSCEPAIRLLIAVSLNSLPLAFYLDITNSDSLNGTVCCLGLEPVSLPESRGEMRNMNSRNDMGTRRESQKTQTDSRWRTEWTR